MRLRAEASFRTRSKDDTVEREEQCGDDDSCDEQSLLHVPILREWSFAVGTACTRLHACLHVDRPYASVNRRSLALMLARVSRRIRLPRTLRLSASSRRAAFRTTIATPSIDSVCRVAGHRS